MECGRRAVSTIRGGDIVTVATIFVVFMRYGVRWASAAVTTFRAKRLLVWLTDNDISNSDFLVWTIDSAGAFDEEI